MAWFQDYMSDFYSYTERVRAQLTIRIDGVSSGTWMENGSWTGMGRGIDFRSPSFQN